MDYLVLSYANLHTYIVRALLFSMWVGGWIWATALLGEQLLVMNDSKVLSREVSAICLNQTYHQE